MICARFLASIFFVLSGSAAAVSNAPSSPQGGILVDKAWPWETTVCTGSNSPPTSLTAHAPFCYSGATMGETVTIKVGNFDQDKKMGDVYVTGSGLSPVKCKRSFLKAEQLITVTNLQTCLPSTVKPSSMKYCSDQDYLVLNAKAGILPVELVMKPAPCPAVLLEEEETSIGGQRNDLLDHSAWIWDASACTGTKDPPKNAPFCYSGSKMGEIVTIKVNSFDDTSRAGSVLVTASGLKHIKCERSFAKNSKTEQLISMPKLHECMPKHIHTEGMKYCSDQNQVLLDAKVGIIPVQMTLIPAPCPSFFLESNAGGVVLAESEWVWDSTKCTGVKDPLTHAPFCYSGSKLGEQVTIKVDSFDSPSNAGHVLVAASGLTRIKNCKRGFSKANQMIMVSKLDECLPSTVKPSGLKYCSDQDKVILDATVGLISVEMVLSQSPCPAAFLEAGSSEILASGAQRLIRKSP